MLSGRQPAVGPAAQLVQHQGRQELAEKEAELQLEKAEAVGSVVRAARTDLRQLVAAQRAAESEAAAAEAAAASAKQDSQALQQQQQTGWKPRVGQTVFVPRLNQAAKVVKVAGSGAITLQAGILKVTVTADEVRQR
ncbi:hypothetical protein D9Q98_009443 [Chlorella vulgaris]|uniref:MutS2 and Smr-associated SH3 domain-containing protein n=1 Tax=Chlorella vulgaris TaxID=3077 RepID=A0A9D4TF83_CHLVU|nr:hypothetical protein D9Q98_009443 [Chlorella vulgaris]